MQKPKGHKEGCKCPICKKMDARLAIKAKIASTEEKLVRSKPEVSVRDKIYDFFNKGCGDGSPEIKALGLSLEEINAYFGKWKTEDIYNKMILKLKPKPALVPGLILTPESMPETEPIADIGPILLNTLVAGQEFESNGGLYRLKPNGRCAFLETPLKVEKYLITIPGDTLVKTIAT